MDIVLDIKQGKLKSDTKGVIVLPDCYKSTTCNGKVYIHHKSNGLLLILFETWQGHDSNMTGVLYCSQTLSHSDLHKYDRTKQLEIEMMIGDRIQGMTGESVEVRLDKKIDNHWYYVSRGLD